MRTAFKTDVAPLPRCGAKAKSTGLPCRRYVLRGTNRCIVHGSGTRRRVQLGTRKVSGRPTIHGKRRDPRRTRHFRLGDLYDVWCELNQQPNPLNPGKQRTDLEKLSEKDLVERLRIFNMLTRRPGRR